jgi:putative membrane protein
MRISNAISRLAAVGAVLAVTGTALAQSDAATAKFVTDAVRSNIAEIRMGELAQQHGQSAEVRAYGETLAADHKTGLQKTSALAKTLGITPPSEPSDEATKMYTSLSKLSGEKFDREFTAHMIAAHENNLDKYEEQTRYGGNPQVVALARDTLPTLEKHLGMAKSLDEKIKD